MNLYKRNFDENIQIHFFIEKKGFNRYLKTLENLEISLKTILIGNFYSKNYLKAGKNKHERFSMFKCTTNIH